MTGKVPLPIVVMDDEAYVSENDGALFSVRGFYTKALDTTPDNVRYAQVKKWPFKVGFWYAISDCGVSEAYIWSQGLAIDGPRYKVRYLQQRLLPFIQNNGILEHCVFWPDKASSHYSTLVLNYLQTKQGNVITKKDNPTNLPQCRPIENCHAIIKRAIFADNFEPKNADELMKRTIDIFGRSQELLRPVYTGLSQRVRKLLDKTRRLGLYATHR